MRVGILVLLGLLLACTSGYGRPIIHSFCLDAGHGGNDPGTSNGAYLEKNLTMDCVAEVFNYIGLIGFAADSAFFTRCGDSDVSIERRYGIANGEEPDAFGKQLRHPVRYFLSVHLNSGGSTARGSCVLVYDKGTQTMCDLGGCIKGVGDVNCPVNAPNQGTHNFELALDVANMIGSWSCSGWQFGAFEQCDGGYLGQAPGGGYQPSRDGILGRQYNVGILENSRAYATVLVEAEFLSNNEFVRDVLTPYYYGWCSVMGGAIGRGLEVFADKDDPSGAGPGGRVVLSPVGADAE